MTTLRVSISQIIHGEQGDSPELLAQFRVNEQGIKAEAGDRTDVLATIPVIDPESGERLEASEDPVRWARLLPQAFRSGDMAVTVEEGVEPMAARIEERRDQISELVPESSVVAAEATH